MRKLLIPLLIVLASFSTVSCKYFDNKDDTKIEQPSNKYSDKLNSVSKDAREFYINWDAPTVKAWPNNKDKLSGEIWINNIRVENFRNGYDSQHLKNVYLKGTPYYVPIANGEEVEIYFKSKTDGSKRTNPVKFKWPWKSSK
jgi:hypothetical protein